MKIRFSRFHPDALLLLPAELVEQLPNAGETELKILLSAAVPLSKGAVDEEELTALLSETYERTEIAAALAFWRGTGVLSADKRKGEPKPAPAKSEICEKAAKIDAEEAPFYSSYELAQAAEEKPAFKSLCSFAEEKLGKVLNTSELAKLYTFLDYLKLPAEVIMLSIEDCSSRGKNSLRYISKQLIDFADSGADTYEKAEAILAKRRRFDRYADQIRALFGLGERKLVPKEKEALENWQKWQFSEEMLTLAFEKTVASAKKPTISYMNKILENWHQNGWETPADVEKGGGSGGKAAKTYDVDDFFEAAVAKTMKDL